MKIIYINHYAGSLEYGMAFRPFYLAKEWMKNGHEVQIIGASYSHLRSSQPKVTKDFQSEKIDNVDYLWVQTPAYKGNGVKRLVNIFTFVFKLIWNHRKISASIKPDVVVASSTYPLDVIPAILIARLTKAKVIHEIHDLWPLTLKELSGFSPLHPFIMLLQWAENYSYRNVDRVVSMLENAMPHLIEHGMSPDKFVFVPNGVDLNDWDHPLPLIETISEIISREKGSGKILVGYAGYHGVANSLLPFLKAAQKLDSKKYAFFLVGDGPLKEDLRKHCERSGSSNIYFFDSIPKKMVPSFLKEMSINYIGAPKSSLYRFGVSPNKLLDYMMSGVPVLNAIEASNNWVNDANCGISVSAENENELMIALGKVSTYDKQTLIDMGQRGVDFVKRQHAYAILAKNFLKDLY